MKKSAAFILIAMVALFALFAPDVIGSKQANLCIIYNVTTIVSSLLLAGYCCLAKKRDGWFLALFSSVFVVNAGYLMLSCSNTLEQALRANRLAYLGSVGLPLSMLMIIMNVCGQRYKKWLPWILAGIAAAVFLIAASPGYLDIYYKEVTLVSINGVSVLEKVYGSWHKVYFVYLLSYFAGTVWVLVDVFARKHFASALQAVMIAAAVFINMGVWLLEQLVKIDFELLAVSYIVSEMFLLGIHLITQSSAEHRAPLEEAQNVPPEDNENSDCSAQEAAGENAFASALAAREEFRERCEYFRAHLPSLTPTEKIVFGCYLCGKTTKEIMADLNIKENTLKYHNKNIYSKLGVSSRKQLLEIARTLKIQGEPSQSSD